MPLSTLITVEDVHAEVIREALEGAGIGVRVVRLQPFRQLDHLRHQRRPLVDVQVDERDQARARAALALLQIEASEAALAEAGEGSAPSRGPAGRRAAGASPLLAGPPAQWPLSSGFGLMLALVFPVAGPIYAGARTLVVVSAVAHAVGFLMYLVSAADRWYRSDLHLELGLLVLAAARLLDVVGTLEAVRLHNRRQDEAAGQPEGSAAGGGGS